MDISATLPGRGAWVHPTIRCVETAIARKAVARALRADGALGTEGLLAKLALLAESPPSNPHDTVGVPSGTP